MLDFCTEEYYQHTSSCAGFSGWTAGVLVNRSKETALFLKTFLLHQNIFFVDITTWLSVEAPDFESVATHSEFQAPLSFGCFGASPPVKQNKF